VGNTYITSKLYDAMRCDAWFGNGFCNTAQKICMIGRGKEADEHNDGWIDEQNNSYVRVPVCGRTRAALSSFMEWISTFEMIMIVWWVIHVL